MKKGFVVNLLKCWYFFIFAASIVVFWSCGEESGLGSAIDTKAPVLSIDYPKASGSAIRDSFVLAGEVSDDKSISRITVVVKSLDDGGKITDSYFADYDVTKKRWWIDLNSYDPSNADYHNGWQYPDGRYEFSVTAFDNAGNNSGTYSKTFELDNTPPLFIISNPGVIKKTGLSPSAYGSIFTIDGTISDNHTISFMDVMIFDINGVCVSSESYEGANIPFYREEDIATAGGTSVQIAQYANDASSDKRSALNTRYTQLHESDTGTEYYYAEIKLTDSTKVYKNPWKDESRTAEEIEADELGNSTSSLYLYDDVYSPLISSKKGLGLSAANLKDIISGVYDGDLDRSEILALLEQKRYDTSDSSETEPMANKLSFSLNPEANPTYTVNGFEFGFTPDDVLQSASSGNTVSVTISAGLDGTNIAPEKVRVWMKTLSSRPADPEPIKSDLILLETEVEALERDDETEFIDALHETEETHATNVSVNGESWKLIYDYSLNNSKGNSVVTKTFSVTLPEGIEMSKYYILGITGCDIDDVEFAQKTVYGFEGNTIGVPPIITFDSPQNLSVWPDFEKPEFKGTAVIPSKSLYLTELSAEIRITDESTNTLIGEYTDKTTCRIEDEKNVWTNSELGALTWNTEEEKWYLDATKFPELIEKFNHEKAKGLHWLATVKVSGKSSSAHEGEFIQSIHIDTVSPKVVLSSISPSVIGSGYFGAGDQDIYLNGKISITGNVEDLNLSDDDDAVSYDILASVDGSEPVSILSELIAKKEELGLDATALDGKFDGKLGKVFSINIPIDTNMITKYFGETDRKIQTEFVVTAKDKAGNVGTYSSKLLNKTDENPAGKNFVIYQETNRPKITFGINTDSLITQENGIEDGKNLFGITNNNILEISVSDDDSSVDCEIFIWKLGTAQPEASDHPKIMAGKIYYTLPSVPGTYNVKVVARDFIRTETNTDEDNPTGINVTGPFVIGVDPGAPVLSVEYPSKNLWISADKDIVVSGTVSKRVGVTVSGYVYSESEGEGESEPENNQVKAVDVTDIELSETENKDKTYSFTGKFKLPADAQGKYVLRIEAKDVYKHETYVDIDIGVDKTAPVWKEDYEKSPFRVSKKPYSYTEGETGHTWYNAESLLFSGAWKESKDESGIESVYWKVIKAGETDEPPSSQADFANSFVTKREEGTDYEVFSQNLGSFIVKNDENGNAQPNIVYMMACDNAGNHSAVKKFYIYIDAESPSFESDKNGTQYSNKKFPIEVSGSATDDAAGVASVSLTISLDNTSVPLEISEGVREIQSTLYEGNDASDVNRKRWKATIPQSFLETLQEKPYAVKAIILDKAGNKSSSTIFRIDVDDKEPEIKNIDFTDGSETYTVCRGEKDGSEVFYAHNGNNFSLTGSVQDAKAGIESIKIYADLNPEDENPVPITEVTSLPVYNIDLSKEKYPGESVKLTLVATDHAGNQKTHELNVVFDNQEPEDIHAIDANKKDIFFRIGENANDDVEPSDSLWNDDLDKDVGGKYSEGTYGNASTVRIRGTFREDGSGLAMIYYKLISGEMDESEILEEGKSFFANYKTLADGYFAPLKKDKYESRRVFFNLTENGKVTNKKDDEVDFNDSNSSYKDFAKDFGTFGGKSYATITSNYDNVISGFSLGKNYLFLAAVDNVGNAVLNGIKLKDSSAEGGYVLHPDVSINVDNQVPQASRTKAEDEDDIYYTNKKAGSATNTISITGTASDADAGLRSVVIKNGEKEITVKNSEYGKIEITSPDDANVEAKTGDKNWSWKAEIKADKFFADSPDGSTSIVAIVTDDAGVGNSQTVNLATVVIDTKSPEVVLDMPKDANPTSSENIEINGIISLSGSVKDENTLSENNEDDGSNTVTAIRYVKVASSSVSAPENDSTSWKEIPGLSITGSYTYTASGFDTTKFDDETFYYIQTVAVDKSGNTGYSPACLVKISQDSDRPKVKINNLTPNGDSYILKYGNKAQVTGTLTDDDSTNSQTIKKLFITESAYTGTGTEPTNLVSFTASTGDFTFTPSDTEDGTKTFYIYIEDNDGGKFYTTATVTGEGTESSPYKYLSNPKIYVKGIAVAERENTSVFSYGSDGTNPVVGLGEGLPYASTEGPVAKDDSGNDFALTTADKQTTNATLNASFKTGGSTRRYVKFYFTASDASGVSGMSVEFKNENGEPVKKLASASKIGDVDMTGFEPSGTFDDSSNGASNAKWETGLIDMSEFPTGLCAVSVTPYDNAGLSGNGTFQFYVDNSAPEIEVRSPSGTEVTGSVSISGTANDTGAAGTSNIQWIVPATAQTTTFNAKTSDAEKLAYLQSLSWNGGDKALADKATITSWQFDFNGQYDTASSDSDHFVFSAGNPLFNVYDKPDFATNDDYASTGLYYLPVYFLATDALGNASYSTGFYIKHNPDADRPKLVFTYPTKDNYKSDSEQYAVLGGTIRATGSAEIPSGTTTVGAIYYQIADEDGAFDSDDMAQATTYGYTVVRAWDAINAIRGTSFTSSTTLTDAQLKEFGFASNEAFQSWWGVKANGTASWNLVLNSSGELNPSGTSSTKNITLRACGINADGKMGAWTSGDNVIAIHVDNTAPVISGVVNQYSNGTAAITAVPTTAYTSSQTYETDMYLRGYWTFVATVVDETEVKSYSVLKGSTALTKGTDYFVESGVTDSSTSKNGYRLYIPIPKDSGIVEITINASDNDHDSSLKYSFKIDETAPSLEKLTGNGTSFESDDFESIEDSNYQFIVAGSSTDEGSGVENILFYYMRKNGVTGTIGTDVVMDPMITSSTDDAKVPMSDLTARTFTQGNDEFTLYAKAYTGTATTETFTSDSAYDAHVRVGGIVEIDGILHTISAISGNTVTFSPSLSAAKTSFSAYFPIAQVIDNSATEKVKSYSANPFTFEKGDDGDKMPESFSKSSKTWTWDASIHSTNMPDGPASLVILAFDNAGNVAGKTINTKITNNAPRLAKVFLGTDLSGDGKYVNSTSLTEIVEYNIIGAEGVTQSAYTLDFTEKQSDGTTAKYSAGTFKIKNGLAVIPELTGGNGDIGMVLKTDATGATAVTGTVTDATSSSSETDTDGNISASFTGTVAGTFKGSNASYKMHAFTVASGDLGDDGTNKGMSFTFWDSTEETTQGTDSQYSVLYVKNFTVAQNDTTKPTVVVNPFYWNSASENSLYGNSSGNGHIELEADWKETDAYKKNEAETDSSKKNSIYDGDPKVSGKITFTGTAYDDVRLGSISVTFGSVLSETVTATYDSANSVWTVPEKTVASDGYEFSVVDATSSDVGNYGDSVYFDQKGHKVYWTLSIDTAKITNQVGTDVVLTVLAKDAKGNTTAASSITPPVTTSGYTVTDGTTNKPTYQMDVVPYITSVTTKLSDLKKNNPSVYNRTARGHYPVASDEKITFSGFNLGDNTTLDVLTLTASGAYDFAVNGITALNNKNDNDAKGNYDKTVNLATSPTGSKSIYDNYYNRVPNGDNNNLLTDDVVIDVWQINSNVAQAQGSAYIAEPIMKINPVSGMLNFAYNSGPGNFSMANGTTTSHTTWVGNLARMTTAGFTVDENGVTHGITVGLDTNPGSGSAGRMQYVTSKWGQAKSDSRDGGKLGTQGNYEGTQSSRFETIGAPAGTYNGTTYDGFLFMEDRFASPSLATAIHKDESNVEHTYVFLAYYDDLNNEIRFRYGDLNDTTNHTIGRSFGGFQDAWVYGKGKTGDGNHGSFNTNKRPQDYSVIAASGVSGNYLSIDLIKGSTIDADVIVATWQDSVAGNWYYAYKMNPCTDNDLGVTIPEGKTLKDGYWSTPILLASNAGEDCHISVDPRGGVHLAAYDASGANLLYAYFANYNASSHQIVTVDSYNFTGEHLTLDTALSSDGKYVIPFIGYYMSSAKKPKIAKLDNVIKASDGSGSIPSGVDNLDAVNGSWEVSVIPTESLYSENYAYSHVNVGVWKDSDGKITNSTRPAEGTQNVDTWVGNNKAVADETNGYFWGNGTDNPVLGYAIKVGTRGFIETAQMK